MPGRDVWSFFNRTRYLAWCQLITWIYGLLLFVVCATFVHSAFNELRTYTLLFIWQILFLQAINVTNETLAQALRAESKSTLQAHAHRDVLALVWRCVCITAAFGTTLAYVVVAAVHAASDSCVLLCSDLVGGLFAVSIIVAILMAVLCVVLFVVSLMYWFSPRRK